MSLKLKPLGNRLVIEPIEQEDVTLGGIVLPETAKEKPQRGKVLSTGPGDRDESGKRIAMGWMSKRAMWSFSPSIPAPRSKSTIKNCLSSAKAMSSQSSKDNFS